MTGKGEVKNGRKGLPRLMSTLRLVSFGSIMRHLSIESMSKPVDRSSVDDTGKCHENEMANMKLDKRRQTAPTPLAPLSRAPTSHKKANPITPGTIPVAGVKMKITTLNPAIGVEPISIWATVEVSADIGGDEPVNSGWLAPLDVVIILDNV